jgi:hypothetical protein
MTGTIDLDQFDEQELDIIRQGLYFVLDAKTTVLEQANVQLEAGGRGWKLSPEDVGVDRVRRLLSAYGADPDRGDPDVTGGPSAISVC